MWEKTGLDKLTFKNFLVVREILKPCYELVQLLQILVWFERASVDVSHPAVLER